MDSRSIPRGRSCELGFGLIETMIATLLILVGLTAVLGLFTVSMAYNQSHGDLASRATTYAQTKMEELLALPFTDSGTDTTVFPAASSGGTGLGGVMAPNAFVGSIDPAAPAAGYVDYLDYQGTRVLSTDDWFFQRQWKVQANSTATIKVITVRLTARRSPNAAPAPFTVLVSYKSKP